MEKALQELRLSALVAAVDQQLTSRLSPALNDAGLTHDQWRVLSALADGEGHTMSQVAANVTMPAPTLTRVVDKLVNSNLVFRRVDMQDRRKVLIFLAARGRTKTKKLLARELEIEQDIVELLGERRFGDMADALGVMVAGEA